MRKLPSHVVSLIHYVELNEAGWWEKAVDRCVLAVLWLARGPAPPAKIRKDLSKELGLDIKASEVNNSLNRLSEHGQVERRMDGSFALTRESEVDLRARLEKITNLEADVRQRFEDIVTEHCPGLDAQAGKLWSKFNDKLLLPLISDAGARTYEFLVSWEQRQRWESYTDQFLQSVPENWREQLSEALFAFLSPDDPQVRELVLCYLDAYLTVTASGLPATVAKRLTDLRSSAVEFVIFVDSNFVYSILGLHRNPLNEAANDLMELVRSLPGEVKVSFVISPVTFRETQTSIAFHQKQLGSRPYTRNLAEAALEAEIYGVYSAFFERVKTSPRAISAVEYFAPYVEGLQRILAEKGINLFQPDDIDKYASDPAVEADIVNQARYEAEKYGARAKSEHQIRNDVLLWHFVNDLRPASSALPVEAKYWIVTVDYRFLVFDRYKSKQTGTTPVCILPAQLIQVLRFFVPQSDQTDNTMLGTLRLPLITRGFDTEAEKVTLRIIRQLSRYEGIEDLQPETIAQVVTDKSLRTRLASDVGLSDEDEGEAVRNALDERIAEYARIIQQQQDQIVTQVQEIEELSERLRTLEEQDQQRIRSLQELKDSLEREQAERKRLQETIAALKEAEERSRKDQERRAAIGTFRWQCCFMAVPYLALTVVAWFLIPAWFEFVWVGYLVAALATGGAVLVVRWLVISIGRRTEPIAQSHWFAQLCSLSLGKAVLWFLAWAVPIVLKVLFETVFRLVVQFH